MMLKRPMINLAGRPRRGMTFIEMVVALMIVMTIMTGVVWAFIELLQSHDRARARMDATANARSAMEVLSNEIKRARNTTGTLTVFVGTSNSSTGGGDRTDNDGDGDRDEELLNAADDDADWALTTDRHAIIPAGPVQYAERPVFYQQPDLGDGGIDEDLGQTSATLEFDTFDVPGEPLNRRVRFYIGQDADGQPNTLMKEVRGTDPATSTTVVTTGPLCHNVVGFGAMFWDFADAKTPTANPWQTEWPPSTTPLTSSPSSVYLTISVYAGSPYSYEELPGNLEIETVKLSTVVNVEAVLADPAYIAQRLPVTPIP